MADLRRLIRQTTQNVQCLYNLDRRVHAVKAYPILSPQGASIFLYGHENGVTVVWRGGRRLKEAKKAEAKPVANNDAVMVLDSDSDDGAAASSASAPFVDQPVFEDELMDTPEDGFPEVVQTLDLALGAAVLHLAVLPLPPSPAKNVETSLLQEQMVFTAACSTSDVYVVTLPLTPPSDESKERPQLQTSLLAGNAGHGAFSEVLYPLGGQSKPSAGVAMTLAKHKAGPSTSASSRPGSSHAPSATRIIVAAHSREAAGTLRLWDVTVGTKRVSTTTTLPSLERPLEPFQTEYLPSPLAGVSFNPTHPSQLLAVSSQHAVRIYDYTIPAIPSDDASEGPFPPQGSWLLSLYPPFVRSATITAVRKPIVAASWIAHGHAILALLADGQWGIWDIDRASASASSGGGGLFANKSATSGIRGASLTAFAISGQVEGTSPLRNPAAAARKSAEGEFVPMTPHTRRDVLASTFSGNVERLVALRGGVEVVRQRTPRGGGAGHESAVLWLGGADYLVAVIPDVARFWDAQLRRTSGGGMNLFSGGRPARMVRLTDLSTGLMGERCCGVSVAIQQLPSRLLEDEDEDEHLSINAALPIEVLVQGESRLVVVHESSEDASNALSSKLLAASRKRQPRGTAATAIVVEPRPHKVGVVPTRPALNKSLFEPPSRPAALNATQRSLFHNESEVTLTQSMMVPPAPAASAADGKGGIGLAFAGDLSDAANASDDEEAAEDRNVEEEMLDIMEIDRALEAMDERRDSGAKNVFFEGE